MSVLEQFALPGRVAVVTGGNRGLGRAIAHAPGEAGAAVAAEWAPFGVRVNAVAPGYVRPEIAPPVLFLASPASSPMTGSVLVIDGGSTVC